MDSGRKRPKTYDFLRKMAIRTLPRHPPGEGGAKNKIKNHFKHIQVLVADQTDNYCRRQGTVAVPGAAPKYKEAHAECARALGNMSAWAYASNFPQI